MNKLFLSGLTVLGFTFTSTAIARPTLAMPSNTTNADTEEVVVDTLESEAQDPKTDLQETGTEIQETLETEADDARGDLKNTGTGIQNTLETTGHDVKDTLRGVGEVPYRNLKEFFVGD